MNSSRPASRPASRLVGTGLLVFVLLAVGVALGANFWPRMDKVEQGVVAPIRQAAAGRPDFAEALPDLVGNACAAIVGIVASEETHAASGRKGAKRPADARNGFFVSADGYLVTSARGLPDQGSVQVRLDDGRTFDAAIRGIDPATGFALLKAPGSDFAFLHFADQDYPQLGTAGFVPFLPRDAGCSVQSGIVSSDFVAERVARRSFVRLRPSLELRILGAPLLDGEGKVLGVSIASADSDPSTFLPGPTAARITSELLRGKGAPPRPFGILADNLTPGLAGRIGADRERGAVIALVVDGSPAGVAGLRAGDLVLAAAGSPISGASELERVLDGGTGTIDLSIERGAEHQSIRVKGR